MSFNSHKSIIRGVVFLLITLICGCDNPKTGSQGKDFIAKINPNPSPHQNDPSLLDFFDNQRQPIPSFFTSYSAESIQPEGWILAMMTTDLTSGIVGALDRLYPGIKSDDLYNKNQRGGMEDLPEMGDLVLTGADWEKSIMWWNAETTGNWWDGYIRHAFLTQNQQAIAQSKKIVENILIAQDTDGYIGIYKPNLRYKHKGSNGELWAQTTAFRALLGYYEFTGEQRVIDAVEKAVQRTMEAYGPDRKNPFDLENAFGGVTHGVMFTDVCESLYRITKKTVYLDYATYLYRAFSSVSINRSFNDLRYPFLMEKDNLFEGHAVHTYEHLRAMTQAYYNTGYPELKIAFNNMLEKLDRCILPSGAGHGNEWIAKLEAHPTHTSAEYCSMVELRNSYGSLLQKTGKITFADAAEKLTYNALLGFRNENGTAIAYGKSDNCFILNGQQNKNGEASPDPRYKYSPTHSEPAVCCVPNYGRNLSYFLNQMYMKSPKTISVLMYGPSKLTTYINNTKVTVEQITQYPWENKITFSITTAKPLKFKLMLRYPKWSKRVQCSNQSLFTQNGDFIEINKVWGMNQKFDLMFDNPLLEKKARDGTVYLQKGPLIYAYEIPHVEKSIKQYTNTQFTDYYCFPANRQFEGLKASKKTPFGSTSKDGKIVGNFYDSKQNKSITTQLVPMGKTVLRRVTFPKQ